MAAASGVISGRRRRSRASASDLQAESSQCIDQEDAFRILELQFQNGYGLGMLGKEDN